MALCLRRQNVIETVSVEELQDEDRFNTIMARVEGGERFYISVDGAVKAVLLPYGDYEAMCEKVKRT